MAKLIPSILTRNADEIGEKIKFLESVSGVTNAQIDFADGKFVENATVSPNEIGRLSTKLELEAHLMVFEPQRYYHELLTIGVRLLFIHYESFKNDGEVLNALQNAKDLGFGCGLAINPNTHINVLERFMTVVDEVLVMSVNPGLQGQKFIPQTIGRVAALRDLDPRVIIEVDGGVKLDNVGQIVGVGANKVNVGSGIWQTPDVKQTIYEFLKKLKN